MLLDILTPEKLLFEGEVKSIKLPGTNGEFEILNNHAPIISTLSKGDIYITYELKNHGYWPSEIFSFFLQLLL